jgi:hypothetical protein
MRRYEFENAVILMRSAMSRLFNNAHFQDQRKIVNRRETLFASTTMPPVWVGLKVTELASPCMMSCSAFLKRTGWSAFPVE